jgi:hypothetical protein
MAISPPSSGPVCHTSALPGKLWRTTPSGQKQIQAGRTLTLVEDLNGEDRLHEPGSRCLDRLAPEPWTLPVMLKSAKDSTQ